MKKILIFIFFVSSIVNSQPIEKEYLNGRWQFSEMGIGNWLPASVPGTVHTDLFKNGVIEEPFFSDNEKKLQWIEEKNWEYKLIFSIDDAVFKNSNIDLIFEGLDTYAKVYLNDTLIICADNMFKSWQYECKRLLKKENNKLYIQFFSPVNVADSIAGISGVKLPGGNQVFIRKAPYHFGWDWGPRFATSGIWRPVYIQAWSKVKIEDVTFQQRKITREEAELYVPYFINCGEKDLYTVTIKDISNKITYAEKTDSLFEGYNLDFFNFTLYNPRLWWTRELGTPEIYTFRFEVKKNNYVVDEKIYNIGIRKIELIREKDSVGESFYFKLNDVPIFIKGANYIPSDNFLPRVSKDKYEEIIKNCNRSNINLLRVWGGGVYEDEEFYRQCDFNGILVWQDFMFACGMYPGDSAFLKNVRIEVSQNISRLKNHPCIALWCGNNEIDEGWKNWGWQKQFGYTKKDSEKIWKDYLKIFEGIIPEVLENVLPSASYIPTSPKIGWGHAESLKVGDSHYWGVWWGNEPFDTYRKKIPRFMSEYGFQGFPDMKTIESFTLPEDRYLYSNALKNHQKHPVGFETINNYLMEEYGEPMDLHDYIYKSQLLQGYGMLTAIEAHRRAKPYCVGTVYWQLNDCWPVVSWSGIDFYGRWKALQYFVKEGYNEVLVSPVEEDELIKIYIVSDNLCKITGLLKMRLIDFDGKTLWEKDTNVILPGNSSGIYYVIKKDELLKGIDRKSILLNTNLELLSGGKFEKNIFFDKQKNLDLKIPELKLEYKNEGAGITVYIASDKFVKNLFLYTDEDVYFSDNYFDLIPGKDKVIYCSTKLSIEELEKKLILNFILNNNKDEND